VPGLGLVAACGLGIMMTAIDATAINVALADIRRELHTNVSALQLVVNAFTLALVVVVVAVGRLADLLGRRRIYIWGFVGYSLASVVCALAPGEVILIAGRLLLGFAGAILFSVSLALLRAGFPENRLQWAIGVYSTLSAVGLIGTDRGALAQGRERGHFVGHPEPYEMRWCHVKLEIDRGRITRFTDHLDTAPIIEAWRS
jgi:MFS family permease